MLSMLMFVSQPQKIQMSKYKFLGKRRANIEIITKEDKFRKSQLHLANAPSLGHTKN